METDIISTAVFSEDRKHRYVLTRIWDSNNKRMVNFIGLNPSTANESENDPTIRKCIAFAKSWGYGGMYMTNLFAYSTKDPSILKEVADPIGKENDKWLKDIEQKVEQVVFAWGTNGTHIERDKAVIKMIEKGHYIQLSINGHPKHPLYLRGDLTPQKFNNNI